MRKKFRKKIRGDSTYIATMLSIFLILVLFMGLLYTYGGAINRNDVERVHRKYLLAMEKDGYLTSTNRLNLVNELASLGCTNISVSGSLSPVGYGNMVLLVIECDLEMTTLQVSASGAVAERRLKHLVIRKTGTALY